MDEHWRTDWSSVFGNGVFKFDSNADYPSPFVHTKQKETGYPAAWYAVWREKGGIYSKKTTPQVGVCCQCSCSALRDLHGTIGLSDCC